jgi:hypothetical protein
MFGSQSCGFSSFASSCILSRIVLNDDKHHNEFDVADDTSTSEKILEQSSASAAIVLKWW